MYTFYHSDKLKKSVPPFTILDNVSHHHDAHVSGLRSSPTVLYALPLPNAWIIATSFIPFQKTAQCHRRPNGHDARFTVGGSEERGGRRGTTECFQCTMHEWIILHGATEGWVTRRTVVGSASPGGTRRSMERIVIVHQHHPRLLSTFDIITQTH